MASRASLALSSSASTVKANADRRRAESLKMAKAQLDVPAVWKRVKQKYRDVKTTTCSPRSRRTSCRFIPLKYLPP